MKEGKLRMLILFSVMLIFFLAYMFRLLSMQIVDGEEYMSMVNEGYTVRRSISAGRGEIVDCYGVPFATNRVSLDITFDRAAMPKENENAIIMRLFDILSPVNESWNDTLPLSAGAPFSFLEGREASVAALKRHLGLADFATAEDVTYWLRERYDLNGYSNEMFRKLAGVRYEMERQGFNVSTPYTFAADISVSTMTTINERNFDFPGVDVVESSVREYPMGDIAPHIIGTIGPIYEEEYAELDHSIYGLNDIIGKSGIEKAYESELRGTNGILELTFNSKGELIDTKTIKEPVPGNTVVLTIDSHLQKVAQDALESSIINLRNTAEEGKGKEAEGGACVVTRVGTGEILAAATYPSYDLATYKSDYSSLLATDFNPLFNRCTGGTYAAGSTFKPVVATAGLMDGVISRYTTIPCNGIYTHYTDYQPGCLGVHGSVDVVHALGVSCNIFFYDTGRILGIDRIRKYASLYGLGQVTGVELSENIGHVSGPDTAEKLGIRWQEGDVLQSSIGQSYNSFSPIQFSNYAATIANKGVRVKAHLVKSINSFDFDEEIYRTPVTIASDMKMSDRTYDTLLAGMEASTRDSSGMYWQGFDIPVASKTGTPETTSGYPNSTFICFAPANEPEVAVSVIIEKGWHGYTGAPVARAVFEDYFYADKSTGALSPFDTLLP